jgi:hypothetical protein
MHMSPVAIWPQSLQTQGSSMLLDLYDGNYREDSVL